jgi:hypothetical protein
MPGLHRSPFAVRTLAQSVVLLIGVAAFGAASTSAQPDQPFDNSSLDGAFALVGVGGSHRAASVGVTQFDGAGGLTRTLLLNEPEATGDGRAVIPISGTGTYTVNADGTGFASILNQLPGGSTVTFTFDFVITDATPRGNGRVAAARTVHMVQREPGLAATLVTFDLTRQIVGR